MILDDKYTSLEKIVKNLLDENNIKYIYQYKVDWLKNIGNLSIDFFLPEQNIAIECQGRFHFEPHKKKDAKSLNEFKKQFERDKIKYDLCKEHNIKIMYFSDVVNKTYELGEIFNNRNNLIEAINNNGRQ